MGRGSMAGRRPKASARREPERASTLDVRPQAEDRADGGGGGASARGRARGRKGRGGGGGFFGRLIYWGLVAGLWLLIAAAGMVVWISARLPQIDALEIPKRPPSIQIAGLDGRVLATRGDMGGAAVPLKELPPHLPKAFVAIEDRRFYSHMGIDA